jgi:hypothetical protein
MEESRMAIAETLKVTNRVDIKVDKVDDKVDKVDDTVNRVDDTVHRVDDTVNRVDDTVNRVDDKVTMLFDGGQNPFLCLFTLSQTCMRQQTSERNSKTGSLLLIPRQIIISHAKSTTKERRPGSSKAVYSNSGSRLVSYGSMANVRPLSSPLLHTPH